MAFRPPPQDPQTKEVKAVVKIEYIEGEKKGTTSMVGTVEADILIERGIARVVEKEIEPISEEPTEPEEEKPEQRPARKPARQASVDSDFDRFLKGVWISADEVNEGDTFEITQSGEIDTDTFESPYLILPVTYNGEPRKVRISRENARKISEVYGPERERWVKKKIRVAAVKEYKGLGKKGMILRGVGRK